MSHVTPVVSECKDDAGVILAQGLAKNQGAERDDEPRGWGYLKGLDDFAFIQSMKQSVAKKALILKF